MRMDSLAPNRPGYERPPRPRAGAEPYGCCRRHVRGRRARAEACRRHGNVRVSTSEQADSGAGLKAQRQAIVAEYESRG